MPTRPNIIKACKYSALSESTLSFWRQAQSKSATTLNPFLTHGFAKACHEIGLEVQVFELYDNNSLIGIFPCQFNSRLDQLLGIVDRVGGAMSDCMGTIPLQVAAEDNLLQCPGVNSIRVDHFPIHTLKFDEEDALQASPHLRLGWMLDMSVDFEKYMEQRMSAAKKRLLNLENRRRKIIKDIGPIRLQTTDSPKASEIIRLTQLKSMQYQAASVKDVFSNPKNVDLLVRLSSNADLSATIVLTDVYAGDVVIASHLGIKNEDFLNYWFPVYDIAYKEYSPGLILLGELIKSMQSYGLRYLDFGEGDADYKRIYANYKYWNSKKFIAADNLFGQIAQVSESLRWRIDKFVD